jgi:hypothetical protein
MSSSLRVEHVRELIARAVPETALRTYLTALERCQPDWSLAQFSAAFTATARTLGRSPLSGPDDPALAGGIPLSSLTADVAGRALLLLSCAGAAPDRLEELVSAAYDEGDALEKLAVVRSLALLPGSERFTRIALDSGRSNEVSLIRALACHNPFPARHYDELAWNKLVMKAAGMDLPLDDVLGAAERDNAELSRMALHYVEQQESAGRSFPPSLWRRIAAFPPPGAAGKLVGYISHAVPEQRLGAALALAHVKQARTASFVRERLEVEADTRVKSALVRALEAAGESHA